MLSKRYFKFDGSKMQVATMRCARATANGYHNSPPRAALAHYNAMNRDELRELAKAGTLPGRGSMNKDQLAEALAARVV